MVVRTPCKVLTLLAATAMLRAIEGHMRSRLMAMAVCVGFGALALHAQGGRTREWLTWGGDQERTGWNRGETAISKQNVKRLALKWKTQVDKEVSIEIESGNSMLTTPLVAQNVRTPRGSRTVLYTLSANTIVALDAATGSPIWQRTIDRTVEPTSAANWICTNMSTATPVIDKATSTIYMISQHDGAPAWPRYRHRRSEGDSAARIRDADTRATGVSISSTVCCTQALGEDAATVQSQARPHRPRVRCAGAGPQIRRPPATRLRVLVERPRVMQRLSVLAVRRRLRAPRLVGARPRSRRAPASGGGAHDCDGHQDPARPITRLFTSTARPNGAWSRAGLAWAHDSLLVQTADGPWEPAQNLWGQTLLRRWRGGADYFTPPNLQELNGRPRLCRSGGTLGFTFQNRPLVVSGGKDGTIYLDRISSLGGSDHRTPLFSLKAGNDDLSYASMGVWGAPATYVNARNERWV